MRAELGQQQIFICYRRNDTGAHAGRLNDALCNDFGEHNVFFDQGGGIDGGDDWKQVIDERLESCAALLVLIGINWQPARLADPDDLVRREISSALARDVRVVPILVNDATLPSAAELPEEIRPLLNRQMMELTDRHWRADYEQIAKSIRKEIARRKKQKLSTPLIRHSALAALAVVLGLVLFIAVKKWMTHDLPTATDTTPTSTHTTPTFTAPPVPTEPLLGVNLSYMNNNWSNPALRNLSFGFVDVDDQALPRLWKEAHDRSLIRGVYQVLYDMHDPTAQAERFAGTAKPLEQDVLVGVNVSPLQAGKRSSKELSADLHRYLIRLEQRTGKRPFIYVTTDSWNANFEDTFGFYPLWLTKGERLPRGWSRVSLEQEVKDGTITLTFGGRLEELKSLARKR